MADSGIQVQVNVAAETNVRRHTRASDNDNSWCEFAVSTDGCRRMDDACWHQTCFREPLVD